MSKKQKLGRNPLKKLEMAEFEMARSQADRIIQAQKPVQMIIPRTPEKPPTDGLEKIKEMQLQVDWQELFDATIAPQIKKISRFFPFNKV